MKFTAKSVWSPAFEVTWIAADAAQLRPGMRSANHHGLMPLLGPEWREFQFMAKDGVAVRVTDRWRFEVQP